MLDFYFQLDEFSIYRSTAGSSNGLTSGSVQEIMVVRVDITPKFKY